MIQRPSLRVSSFFFPAVSIAMLLGVGLMLGLVAGPATAQDADPDMAAPEVEAVHDPYQGMAADGRIPKVDKAALVDHPGRWRYIPEGRIRPGNFLDRFLVSSFLVPIFFQNADVGTGVGVAITDIDFRQQRRREFLGGFFSYTSEGQQSYVLRWRRWLKHLDVPGGGVLQEERSFLRVGGGYRKTLTRRFFGLGASSDEQDEIKYRDEVAFLNIGVNESLPGAFDDFVVELGVRGEYHWLGRRAPNDPANQAFFDQLYQESDGYGLGWLNAGLRWDTRDSQRNPYRGTVIGADIDAALGQSGGRVGAIYKIYGDQTFPIWPLFHDGGGDDEENPPTDTLAFHVETQLSSGNLPFFARPTLGGSRILRGYIAGRWRDDASWAAAAEYRFWVIPRGFTVWRHIRVERVGAALFYEIGSVANDGLELFDAPVRQSYGISGRATIERAAIFRADFGFSEEGFIFSAGFGLSF